MIKLYGFGNDFGVVDASPFVVKVDLFLRLNHLPYECMNDFKYLNKSPKSKFPFIEDNGNLIADSHFILEYLNQTYQLDVDGHLTDTEKAMAVLIKQSLDEGLYWGLLYARWQDDDMWPLMQKSLFSVMPFPLNYILPRFIRKGVVKKLNEQGFGRHSKNEILALMQENFAALSELLGNKEYFFGEKISTFDVVVYSHLSQFTLVNYDSDYNDKAKLYDNLMVYCQRIHQQFYTDIL
jgi:glutathione S-transferase